jgi:hypothetical protein
LALLAPTCFDDADESADWSLVAFWPTACTVCEPPPASCAEVCFVVFALPAADFAVELLVCVTSPSSPGLKIRTGTLTLLGRFCSDVASELAS